MKCFKNMLKCTKCVWIFMIEGGGGEHIDGEEGSPGSDGDIGPEGQRGFTGDPGAMWEPLGKFEMCEQLGKTLKFGNLICLYPRITATYAISRIHRSWKVHLQVPGTQPFNILILYTRLRTSSKLANSWVITSLCCHCPFWHFCWYLLM